MAPTQRRIHNFTSHFLLKTHRLSIKSCVGKAAVIPGHSLNFAFDQKMRGAAKIARDIPIAFKSLRGWHRIAVREVKRVGQALARQTGRDESECCRLAISASQLNSTILVNQIQSAPQGPIDVQCLAGCSGCFRIYAIHLAVIK